MLELSRPSVWRVSRCLFSSGSQEAGEVPGSPDSFLILEKKYFTASRNYEVPPGHIVELFLHFSFSLLIFLFKCRKDCVYLKEGF